MTVATTFGPHTVDQLLAIYADAACEGRQPTSPELGAVVGFQRNAASHVRQALSAAGLLVVEAEAHASRPAVCRLTPAAWARLGRRPPAPPKPRRCLRCRSRFLSAGPIFVCDTCKLTEAWRHGGALPASAATHPYQGAF